MSPVLIMHSCRGPRLGEDDYDINNKTDQGRKSYMWNGSCICGAGRNKDGVAKASQVLTVNVVICGGVMEYRALEERLAIGTLSTNAT